MIFNVRCKVKGRWLRVKQQRVKGAFVVSDDASIIGQILHVPSRRRYIARPSPQRGTKALSFDTLRAAVEYVYEYSVSLKAAKTLTALSMEHLVELEPVERNKRLRAFRRAAKKK